MGNNKNNYLAYGIIGSILLFIYTFGIGAFGMLILIILSLIALGCYIALLVNFPSETIVITIFIFVLIYAIGKESENAKKKAIKERKEKIENFKSSFERNPGSEDSISAAKLLPSEYIHRFFSTDFEVTRDVYVHWLRRHVNYLESEYKKSQLDCFKSFFEFTEPEILFQSLKSPNLHDTAVRNYVITQIITHYESVCLALEQRPIQEIKEDLLIFLEEKSRKEKLIKIEKEFEKEKKLKEEEYRKNKHKELIKNLENCLYEAINLGMVSSFERMQLANFLKEKYMDYCTENQIEFGELNAYRINGIWYFEDNVKDGYNDRRFVLDKSSALN